MFFRLDNADMQLASAQFFGKGEPFKLPVDSPAARVKLVMSSIHFLGSSSRDTSQFFRLLIQSSSVVGLSIPKPWPPLS